MNTIGRLAGIVFLGLILGQCKQESTPDPAPTPVAHQAQVETVVNSFQGWYITFDAADNLYISDPYRQVIRKVTPDKVISVYAGTGKMGLADGEATKAQFNLPQGLTMDAVGNLYVAQYFALRKITPTGIVSTIAGTDSKAINYSRPDSILFVTCPALVTDQSGNLLVADYADNSRDNRILKVTLDQRVSIYLGRPFYLAKNYVPAPFVEQIRQPKGLAFDSKGNLFVADLSFEIIKITPQGTASHFAGAGFVGHTDGAAAVATFSHLAGLVIDKSDNLYVSDGPYIRKITPDGMVSTLAGGGKSRSTTGQPGYQDGPGNEAQFTDPTGLAFDSKGDLYVADGVSIRKIKL